MVMRFELTNHVQSRLNRLAACITTLELGDIIFEYESREKPITFCLTSTGIMLIKSTPDGKLITGYMAKTNQITRVYRNAGKKPPHEIMKKAYYNMNKYPHLLTLE